MNALTHRTLAALAWGQCAGGAATDTGTGTGTPEDAASFSCRNP
jgi:hypothetical protein